MFTGSGTTGAYHAGVLRALDESGVKIDLVVGSGHRAPSPRPSPPSAGGAEALRQGRLLGRRALARLLPAAAGAARSRCCCSACRSRSSRCPCCSGLLLGILFPLLLIADRVVARRRVAGALAAVGGARGPERSLPGGAGGARLRARDARDRGARRPSTGDRRSRFAEAFESFLDAEPGLDRLRRGLWEIARGAALSGGPASEAELGPPLRRAPRREPRRAGLPRADPARGGPRPRRGRSPSRCCATDGVRAPARGPRRRGGPARARPGRALLRRARHGPAAARWRCRCGACRSRRAPCTPARRTA